MRDASLVADLRFVLVVLSVAIGVLARRVAGRRWHPDWSLRLELIHGVSRTMLDRAFVYGLPWLRRLQNRSSLSRSIARRVSFEPAEAGGVAAEWCTPERYTGNRTVLNLHGGGYVFGSVASHRELVARIALDARARVLALDYRLGPEHQFPTAQDDCLAAARWLLGEVVDAESLGLVGDSAGAALCLATLLDLRDEGRRLPAAAVLLCPWVDPLADGGTVRSNAQTDIADRSFLVGCFERYVGAADPGDRRLSPVHADLTGLPPLLIQVGGAEMVLDQSRELLARAQAAGVAAELSEYPAMFHDFQAMARYVPEGAQAVREIATFLGRHLKAPPRVPCSGST